MISKRENILEMLKKNDTISGEKIARQLDISRTAVWKHIQTLKTKGYNIQSIKKKGYHLSEIPDKPIQEEIATQIQTKLIGKHIHYFSCLPSTNNYAKTLIKKNIPEGTIIVSDIQTEGRGRKNRTWNSDSGGLWFSIILYPELPPQHGMIVTMAASIAIAETIKEITDIHPTIKWPNDVLINGKKICGILTELDAEIDAIHYLIVGIGLNVNNTLTESIKQKATTLQKECNQLVSRVHLLRRILEKFDILYQKISQKEYEYMKTNWLNNTDIIGKKLRIHKQTQLIEGTAIGITDTGSLILQTDQGEKQILTGDVEYIND